MSSKPNFVFDTNIIVSTLLFENSKPALALQEAFDRGNLLLAIEVAEELAEVLRRSKFDRYVKRKTREEFLRAFILEAVFVEIIETMQVCRAPKDNKFLELAVNDKASHLITGDVDLLALNPFQDFAILAPSQFLETLTES